MRTQMTYPLNTYEYQQMRTPNENNRLERTRTQYCESNISMHQNTHNICKDKLVKHKNT